MPGRTPRLPAPPGACDTHMHVYGPLGRYPMAKTARLPPLEWATLPPYRALMRRLGLSRVVVVQPSAYGTDNRCTLDAMAELGPDTARGVAVVEPDTGDAELERLTAAGIRGLRFFMLPGGALGWEHLERLAARVHAFGWHINLQMDGREHHTRLELFRRLPGTLVFDHNGKFLEPVGVDHPGFRAMLTLLENGRTWVKVSAPYETSKSGPPDYADVGVLARALIRHAPERCLWASNWPHPSAQQNPPDDADLLDLLLAWAPDEATRRRILVDNPARLYGF